MRTDGSHLSQALHFAKKRMHGTIAAQADTSKGVAAIGFSMGAHEAIHAYARHPDDIGAYVSIGGSLMPLATILGWNCACAYCVGGNSPYCCSDTPVPCCGHEEVVKSWSIPSLFVTSESELSLQASYQVADKAGGESTVITFKDESLPLPKGCCGCDSATAATGFWPVIGLTFMGFPHHFALNQETPDVTHIPVAQFLNKHFAGGDGIEDADLYVGGKVSERHPVNFCCCQPFPLFCHCC